MTSMTIALLNTVILTPVTLIVRVSDRRDLIPQGAPSCRNAIDQISLPLQPIRLWRRTLWLWGSCWTQLPSHWEQECLPCRRQKSFSLAQSRGPVGVVFRMMQSIGWNPLSPTQWRTSQGVIMHLLTLPPAQNLSQCTTALVPQPVRRLPVARLVLGPPKRLRERFELSSETQPTHPVLRLTLSQRRWFHALLEGKSWDSRTFGTTWSQ